MFAITLTSEISDHSPINVKDLNFHSVLLIERLCTVLTAQQTLERSIHFTAHAKYFHYKPPRHRATPRQTITTKIYHFVAYAASASQRLKSEDRSKLGLIEGVIERYFPECLKCVEYYNKF